LLDFGIAKLLTPGQDSTETTAPGEERLTPICASPEQTDGRTITEASDVYALGALLYEMLSGQKPHTFSTAHPSRAEVARVVREQEPPPPSAVAAEPRIGRLLRGSLDAIVMKALRKEPAMRYQAVADLAADIRRHRDRQPVLASGATAEHPAKAFPFPTFSGRAVVTSVVLLLLAGFCLPSGSVRNATAPRVHLRLPNAQRLGSSEEHRRPTFRQLRR
jgi:serine/threonine protein kinase